MINCRRRTHLHRFIAYQDENRWLDVRANVLPVYDTTAIHARAAVEWMLDEPAHREERAAA